MRESSSGRAWRRDAEWGKEEREHKRSREKRRAVTMGLENRQGGEKKSRVTWKTKESSAGREESMMLVLRTGCCARIVVWECWK